MKKSIFALSLSACFFFVTLCAINGCGNEPNQPLTPQQQFQNFCTAANTMNGIVLTLPGVSADVVKNVGSAQLLLNKVCTSGVTLTALNLQNLQSQGIPLLNLIVGALPPTPQNEAIKLDVSAAEFIIPILLADLPVSK